MLPAGHQRPLLLLRLEPRDEKMLAITIHNQHGSPYHAAGAAGDGGVAKDACYNRLDVYHFLANILLNDGAHG